MGLSGAMIGDIKDNTMLVDWHELFLQIAHANRLFLSFFLVHCFFQYCSKMLEYNKPFVFLTVVRN